MIINPGLITYFLTGKQVIDHKSIINFAKIKGVEVSDSMRKNLSNFLLCKHEPSETTLKNIKLLLKDIVNNGRYSDEIDNISLLDKIDLSTLGLQLKYIETLYSDFFKSANIKDGFLSNEVNNTFKGLYELIALKENGASDAKIEKELFRSKLLPKINYRDSLYLQINNQANTFNLDLLLYYFACMDVESEVRNTSSIQEMFDYLLQEVKDLTTGEFRPPFAYYMSIIKSYYEKEDIKITDREIAEIYDMNMREFYFYTSGKRILPLKTIALIYEQGHILYFMIFFWTKLIATFSNDANSRLIIINKMSLYPKFLDIAKVEYCNFERKK